LPWLPVILANFAQQDPIKRPELGNKTSG
jgi:hypothetical protein